MLLDLNVSDIQIIVHKNEQGAFDFVNAGRWADGFVYFTSGRGYVMDHAGNRHDVRAGDLVLLRVGDKYEFHMEPGCAYVTSAYILAYGEEADLSMRLPFVYRADGKVDSLIRRMCDVWQSRAWDSYTMCRICILEMYMEIFRSLVVQEQADEDVSMAISYIHEHFKTNFSGASLAAHCSVSLSHLRAKFLKQTGCTIQAYRDVLRIEAAKEMLASGHFSVSEIADALGYCDVYHFSKCFKKYTALAPTAYGKKIMRE